MIFLGPIVDPFQWIDPPVRDDVAAALVGALCLLQDGESERLLRDDTLRRALAHHGAALEQAAREETGADVFTIAEGGKLPRLAPPRSMDQGRADLVTCFTVLRGAEILYHEVTWTRDEASRTRRLTPTRAGYSTRVTPHGPRPECGWTRREGAQRLAAPLTAQMATAARYGRAAMKDRALLECIGGRWLVRTEHQARGLVRVHWWGKRHADAGMEAYPATEGDDET